MKIIKNENNFKMQKIKAKVKSLLLESSSNGLPNAIKSERPAIRYGWLFLFLLSTGYGLVTVFSSINSFLEYEVFTKIDIVEEIPSKFPVVTFAHKHQNKNDSASIIDFISNYNETKYTNYTKVCWHNSEHCKQEDIEIIQDKNGFVSFKFTGEVNPYIKGQFHGFYFNVSHPAFLQGMNLMIHNESNNPGFYYGSFNEGVNIPVGFHTLIIVKRIFTYKLSYPYNYCIKDLTQTHTSYDSDLLDYLVTQTNYSYRQKECYTYCLGQEMIKISRKKFNFSIPFSIEHISNVFYFIDKNYQNLSYLFYNHYNNATNQEKLINECRIKCPLECDTIEYQVTMSSSPYTPDYQKNLTSFTIYYQDLEYTKISQFPKTQLFDLISNIGGLLGVFLGISFLSFAELIEIILEVVIILFEKNQSRVNVQPKETPAIVFVLRANRIEENV